MICPRCQGENDDAAKFCGHCGEELPTQAQGAYCSHCGAFNPEGIKYCGEGIKYCGKCGGIIGLRSKHDQQMLSPYSIDWDVVAEGESGIIGLRSKHDQQTLSPYSIDWDAVVEGENCAYHPELQAVGICANCMKPICAQCSEEWSGRSYCSHCRAAARELAGLQSRLSSTKRKNIIIDLCVLVSILLFAVTIGATFSHVPGSIAVLISVFMVIIVIGLLVFSMRWGIQLRRIRSLVGEASPGVTGGLQSDMWHCLEASSSSTLGKRDIPTVPKTRGGSANSVLLGILIGFVANLFLSFIPILGPILAGFIAGLVAGHGMGRGVLAGFGAGISGAVLLAVLAANGFWFFGNLLDMPIIGPLMGAVIVLTGLYHGFLGLVGGAIGGLLRR